MEVLKVKIAAFGLRKFPPSPGAAGADIFAFNLFKRISKKKFHVTVFTKGIRFSKTKYSKNIDIISFPIIPFKGISTLLHSFMAAMYILLSRKYQLAHTQNGGNAIFCHILNFFGVISFCSFDGIDKNRKDWGWVGKKYLTISEFIASILGKRLIIDNIPTYEYFKLKYKKNFTHIPFGADSIFEISQENPLKKYLKNKPYILFVGRFVKDKGIDYLIEAFNKSNISKTHLLVIIGGPSENETNYSKKIKSYKSEKILIPGFFYGKDINKIITDAYCYVQPSFVEGLSPIVLQVIGLKTNILVSDIKENMEIVRDKDFTFTVGSVDSLKSKLNNLGIHRFARKQKLLQKTVKDKYSWQNVVVLHEKLFMEVLNAKS